MALRPRALKELPGQTAGPFLHIGLSPNFCGEHGIYAADLGAVMVNDGTKGERIRITGRVLDGSGTPLTDVMLEIWQADADGLYNSPAETRGAPDRDFTGWGRQPGDMTDGTYKFQTIKPGRVPWPDGRMQAPHVSFLIMARGISIALNTRMYFADEAAANAQDPVLALIGEQNLVDTLIAGRSGDTYTFDIRLQGAGETVFFDI